MQPCAIEFCKLRFPSQILDQHFFCFVMTSIYHFMTRTYNINIGNKQVTSIICKAQKLLVCSYVKECVEQVGELPLKDLVR